MEIVGFGWLLPCILPPTPLAVSDDISYVKSDSSHFIFATCTNSGVLSFIVFGGMELESLEPLSWLML